MDELRIRLIERLCRLPQVQLLKVDAFLRRLPRASMEKSNEVASQSGMGQPAHADWPHAPVHRLSEQGTFIVTAATHNKEHHFRGEDRLTFLESKLLQLARRHEVILEAWAVFSNHYHFVGHTSGATNQLAEFLSHLHTSTATQVNELDRTPERQVWFQYWDTQLTFEKSYLARLNYVHHNAVKHGLVARASDYRWCSAAWFERTASGAQVKTIYSFKIDRLSVEDDYQPVI